jgi:hypothetical protein
MVDGAGVAPTADCIARTDGRALADDGPDLLRGRSLICHAREQAIGMTLRCRQAAEAAAQAITPKG